MEKDLSVAGLESGVDCSWEHVLGVIGASRSLKHWAWIGWNEKERSLHHGKNSRRIGANTDVIAHGKRVDQGWKGHRWNDASGRGNLKTVWEGNGVRMSKFKSRS